MFHFFLIVITPLLCSLVAGEDRAAYEILQPLNIWATGSSSLQRRESPSIIDAISLQDSEYFLWGNPNRSSTFSYANLTLETPDHEKILSLERFTPLLQNVRCGQETILTFKDNTSFMTAMKTWEWVNRKSKNHFLLITDHPNCGSDGARHIFYINQTINHPENLTTSLYGVEKEWNEINNTIVIVPGTAYIPESTNNTKRDVPSILNVKFNPYITVPLDKNVDLFTGLWKPNFNLEPQSESLSLKCDPCPISGSMKFEARFVIGPKKKEASISIIPQNIKMGLAADLMINAKTPSLQFSWADDRKYAVPGLGFSIPKVASFGAVLSAAYGATVNSVSTATNISVGVSAALPSNALLKLDLASKKVLEHKSWKPTLNKNGFQLSQRSAVDVDLWTQIGLGVAATVFDKGFEAGFRLKVPDVNFKTATTVGGKDVQCGGKLGVETEGNIGTELSFEVGLEGKFSACVPIKRREAGYTGIEKRINYRESFSGADVEERNVGVGFCKKLAGFFIPMFSKKCIALP